MFFLVLDPSGDFSVPAHFTKNLRSIFNSKFGYSKNAAWKESFPERSLSQGSDAIQCGPFICFYAEASVKGIAFNKMPNVENYRTHILNTIIGNCKPKAEKRPLTKIHTKSNKCAFCNRHVDVSSLKTVVIRGHEFDVCA